MSDSGAASLAGVPLCGVSPDVEGSGDGPASIFWSFVGLMLPVLVVFHFLLYGCGPLW